VIECLYPSWFNILPYKHLKVWDFIPYRAQVRIVYKLLYDPLLRELGRCPGMNEEDNAIFEPHPRGTAPNR
jgi:hypothetical protein